ncbi:N-acetyl-D-Glu racemase DgcA [Hyphococcus sp. DH-69]|uniref:N-acetyl-D-Glu racemase DgcA n=1 Tax=Hyphococcus formosus TaxID=3143534 RepID=UPI00398B57D4
MRRVSVYKTVWLLKAPFRITGVTFEEVEPVVVEIEEGGVVGRGEGIGVYYLNETSKSLLDEIEKVRGSIEAGLSRQELLEAMPASGARNAIDCALWDLEGKINGKSVSELTGIDLKPVQTVATIGLEATPEAMAEKAIAATTFKNLKVKLNGDQPVERMRAIREARPDATLVIDANQGFTIEQLTEVLPAFVDLGVAMVEQPLPRGQDDDLDGFRSPIPLCADESCLHRGELPAALSKYDMINIKLDKTGGLTEALALVEAAKQADKTLMVGNMIGTSLSMMPALYVAQYCDFVDLDGPLHLRDDYREGLTYSDGYAHPPRHKFWGGSQ